MDIRIAPLKRADLKKLPLESDDLGFGRIFTDRMFTMKYSPEQGWHDAVIDKYHPLVLDPATLVLHYGQEIFEGLKAFPSPGKEFILFRYEENVKRFNLSARRMCMPELDEELVKEAIRKLVALENRWIPKVKDAALYIRPTMIATEAGLGVRASSEYLFFIILSPVGSYFKEGFKPTRLYVSDIYSRAALGGVGEAKTGANYSASLFAQRIARDKGYREVLWLDAKEHKYVEEVGAMNIFFVIDGVVSTPALSGTILHGVTRKSVLQLAKHLGHQVAERQIPIAEVIEGIRTGRVSEAFGSGTAASIAPVGSICFKEQLYQFNNDKVGPIAQQLFDELRAIQCGEKKDPFGWTTRVPIEG